MNVIIPYLFFIYMFIVTWVILLNYETIDSLTSNKIQCFTFISLTISLFTFVGVATLYNLETNPEDFKENIKDIRLDTSRLNF